MVSAAPRGPVPKRSEQRRRTNKNPAGTVTKAPSGAQGGPGYEPPAADELWHPLIRDLYASAGKSGQSEFWEPTDWDMLRIGSQVMSDQLASGRPSAVMFAAWDALMARLLMTEGDRRRMRLELERKKPADPDADRGVASIAAWRGKMAGGAS